MTASSVEKVRFAILKRLITAVICHPLAGMLIGKVFGDRIPSRGLRIDTSGEIDPCVKAYLFWEVYESAEIHFIEEYLRSDLDVVELGSSLGIVACHIARRMRHGKRLICVEANPEMPQRIRRNLILNGQGAAAEVVHAAISYNIDPTTAFFKGKTNLVSSLHHSDRDITGVEVPTTRLISLIEQFGIGEYTLVCDIEGAEAAIFTYDGQSLARCRQMVVELHDTEDDGCTLSVDQLADKLVQELGFRLRARRGSVCVFEK